MVFRNWYFWNTFMQNISLSLHRYFMFMTGFFFWEKRGQFLFAVTRG